MEVNLFAAMGGVVGALLIFLGLFYLARWRVRRECRTIDEQVIKEALELRDKGYRLGQVVKILDVRKGKTFDEILRRW